MSENNLSLKMPQISFYLHVPMISQLKSMWSPDVKVQGIPWRVLIIKRTFVAEEYIGIFLYCAKNGQSSIWSYSARATFKLHVDGVVIEKQLLPYDFNNTKKARGSFIKLSDLNYVENDQIKFEICIEVVDPNDDNNSFIVLREINKSENNVNAKYQLTVENIDKLMTLRTPTFKFSNYLWSFIVSKHHEQLYVSLEPEVLSEICDTTMIATLCKSKSKRIAGEIPPKEITNNKKLIAMEPIISWDQLMKPENELMENNSITIYIELYAVKPELDFPTDMKPKLTNNGMINSK